MRRSMLFPSAVLAVGALAAGPRAQDTRPVLVEAKRVLLAPGEVLEGADARLLIRDGKIAAVGRAIPAEGAARARKVSFESGFVAPGLVLLHDLLGASADLAETIDPFTPDLRAADAFDPFSEVLADRARTGITTLMLAPASANTFGGIACAVKSHGDVGVIASPDGYLKLAFVAESLTDDRYPTSRMGAADLVRTSFREATNPLGPRTPAHETLRAVTAGVVPVAVHARTHAEITTALDLCEELELEPVLLDCTEVEDVTIERLRGSGVTLALAPLDYDSTPERLELPARLAEAAIRFSFLGTDGYALRRSAALAIRHGLDRAIAQASITRVPAEQAGLGDRVGTLRVGRDADLVVLTGDPVEQSSRLLQVWVDGRLVHDAATPAASDQEIPR